MLRSKNSSDPSVLDTAPLARVLLIRSEVYELMQTGKQGPAHGWTMSDICSAVADKYGPLEEAIARELIVREVCGLSEDTAQTEPRGNYVQRDVA
jgi:hypothetical protein